MVSVEQISWGRYGGYEGPLFRGGIRYTLPDNPTEDERRLRLLTATEGGSFDAVNMYDRCIVSVGLIQWCEANYYLTSKLLQYVIQQAGPDAVLPALQPALDLCQAEFKPNAQKQWRFFFKDSRGEVNTLLKQQQLFLGCDGKEGSWTPEASARARLWASCMANVWQNPAAQAAQAQYTAMRMTSFATDDAKRILFDGTPDAGWPGALRAAYLSFAANLPGVASQQLKIAVARLQSPKWSADWCTGVLQQLTFGPGIAIYATRYNDIRPWLEKLWNVQVPGDATALKSWHPTVAPNVLVPVPVPDVHPPAPAPVPPVIAPAPSPGPVVLPEVTVSPKASFLTYLLNFFSLILSLFKRANK